MTYTKSFDEQKYNEIKPITAEILELEAGAQMSVSGLALEKILALELGGFVQ